MFYIDSHGLHGVALPPFRPIENDTVSSSSFSNDSDPKSPLTPLFTLFHLHPHREPVVDQVFPPDLCSPRLISANNSQGLLYEIKEIECLPHPTKPTARRAIYRYRFDFKPDNPTQSTLRLVEIATPRAPPCVHARSTSELNQHSYQGLNGRLGCVWTEEAQNFGPRTRSFSLFRLTFTHPHHPLHSKTGRESFITLSSTFYRWSIAIGRWMSIEERLSANSVRILGRLWCFGFRQMIGTR